MARKKQESESPPAPQADVVVPESLAPIHLVSDPEEYATLPVEPMILASVYGEQLAAAIQEYLPVAGRPWMSANAYGLDQPSVVRDVCVLFERLSEQLTPERMPLDYPHSRLLQQPDLPITPNRSAVRAAIRELVAAFQSLRKHYAWEETLRDRDRLRTVFQRGPEPVPQEHVEALERAVHKVHEALARYEPSPLLVALAKAPVTEAGRTASDDGPDGSQGDDGRMRGRARRKIAAKNRTRPMNLKTAARLMGHGEGKDAVERLRAAINGGAVLCETHTRQQHVFDRNDFPKEVWPKIIPASRN